MSITAKVVNQFRETEHDNHIYSPGDAYPTEGYEATRERVEYLSNIHPSYKKIYLADLKFEDDQTNGIDDNFTNEFPKHAGGGQYLLSNGEKVKGKEEAAKAEEALKEIGE